MRPNSHTFLFALFALISSSIFSQKINISVCTDTSKYIQVELTDLIKNINDYEHKLVEIKGEVIILFEQFAIWPIKNIDFKVSGYPALWLRLDNKIKFDDLNFSQKRLTLRGKIWTNEKGHLSQYVATLADICFIKED